MAFTISINEEAAFEVLFAGPAGPTGPQGIQGIQGVPGQGVAAGGTTGQVLKKLSSANYDTGWSSDISGVAWGAITGTLSAQTDLQTALDAKLSTSAASSTYLPLAGGYITGDIQSINGSEFRTFQSPNSAIIRPYQIQLGDAIGTLTIDAEGISFNSSPFKQTLPFLGLAGYATEGWVTSNFYPLTGNPSGFLTASALTPYSTTVQADALYYPLTGNPSGFIDSSDLSLALSSYLPLAGGTMTGQIFSDFGNGYTSTLSDTGLSVAEANGNSYLDNTTIGFNSAAGASSLNVNQLYLIDSNTGSEIFVTANGLQAVTSIQFNDSTVQTTAYTGGDFLPTAGGTMAGNINFLGTNMTVASSGITFPDSTVQTTAYTGGGGGTWGSITGTLSDQTDLQSALDLKYDATNPSGFINAINGLTPSFDYSVTVSNPPTPDNYSVSEWDRLKFYFPDGLGGPLIFLEYRTDGVFKSDGQEMYPKRTGGSFVGKLLLNQTTVTAGLNIGQTQGNVPSNTVAGDVWILDNINFKSSNGTAKVVANTNTANTFSQPQVIATGTSATLPALRITNQSTTGVSLLVEDTTNPDTNSFVVDASGNVGVGVAVGYTATQKVEVVGNVKADGFLNGAGPVFTVKSVAAHAGGANTHDIFMSVGGSTYRIPAIFVSTP